MKRVLCSLLLLGLCRIPANAQTFTLPQLVSLYPLVDLPSVEARLTGLGWKFNESVPDEVSDRVSWKHRQPNGGHAAVLNVTFCNLASNLFCDYPEAHVSNGQHVFLVEYQPSASVYQAIKQEVIRNKMALATSVMSNSIRYRYTGVHYVVWLQTTKNDDGTPCYSVEIQPRDSIIAQ